MSTDSLQFFSTLFFCLVEDWGSRLLMLTNGALTDVAIDGAGGDNTLTLINQVFRQGGILVNYGMTAKIDFLFTRLAFIKNIEIRGTTVVSKKNPSNTRASMGIPASSGSYLCVLTCLPRVSGLCLIVEQ